MPRTLLKYIIIGDTNVGKSSLMFQFARGQFNPHMAMTIAVEWGKKQGVEVSGRECDIEIWDTGGQEKYRALTRQYYRDADACLVVFDLTCRQTFEHVAMWMEHARVNACNPNLVVTLVGNKADCPEAQRQVTTGEAYALAAEQGCEYRELSAKDGEAVARVFVHTAERIFKEVELARATAQQQVVIDGAGRLRYTASSSSSSGPGSPLKGGGTVQLHRSYQKSDGGLCC